jgi:hypothetical protein
MRPANDVAPKFLCAKPDRQNCPPDLPAAALGYAAGGWPIFPVAENRSKPPLIKLWPELATSASHIVLGWWQWRCRANIALYTVDRFILDVDPRHDGPASLKRLIAANGALPRTVTSHTPSGGWHIYFATTRDRIGPSCGRVGPGLDVRSNRSYIVLPPSVRLDGRYRWVKGRGPDDIGMAPTPEWLLELAEPPPPPPPEDRRPIVAPTDRLARYALDQDLAAVERAQKGTRNLTLFVAARKLGRLCAEGLLAWSDVRNELIASAQLAGLPALEASITVRSAFRSRGLQA